MAGIEGGSIAYRVGIDLASVQQTKQQVEQYAKELQGLLTDLRATSGPVKDALAGVGDGAKKGFGDGKRAADPLREALKALSGETKGLRNEFQTTGKMARLLRFV